MKKILLAVAFVVALNVFASFGQTKTSQSNPKPSRLGLIGNAVFVVKQVAPFVKDSELKTGDVIIYVQNPSHPNKLNECSEISSIEVLQNLVASSTVGTMVEVEFLRFNSTTKKFDNRVVSARTLPHPASATRSTLGLVLEMGFMVKEIDPSTEQPELKINDIITYTATFGDITDINSFTNGIRRSEVNSTITAEVARFNPTLNDFESKTVSLRVFPYPSYA